MNNSPVKSELYVALEMVELTQFLPFTKKLLVALYFGRFKVSCLKIFHRTSNKK